MKLSGKELADIYIDAYQETMDRLFDKDFSLSVAAVCVMIAAQNPFKTADNELPPMNIVLSDAGIIKNLGRKPRRG